MPCPYCSLAGYRAAGTADTLRALGKKYSLSVSIVDLVEDGAGVNSVDSVDGVEGVNSVDGGDGIGSAALVVSSTRARELLAVGDGE
jgi:FAD synthase